MGKDTNGLVLSGTAGELPGEFATASLINLGAGNMLLTLKNGVFSIPSGIEVNWGNLGVGMNTIPIDATSTNVIGMYVN